MRESRRARLLGGFTLACVVAGYFGALFPVSSPIEPYLFLVPGALAASIPAAEYLSFVRPRRAWAASSPRLRVVLTAAAVVIVPRLYRTVASYVPELLPTRVLRSDVDRRVSALVGLNEPLPVPLRHEAPPPGFRDIAAQVSTEIGTRGRIVVDDAALAAFLALTTELHVLGPLAERGASSTDADPTALLSAPPDHAALSRYLERFAVAEVVLCGAPGVLDRGDPLLDVPELVGGCRVRRVLREPSFFEAGRGRVDAHLGFIGVSGAVGERVTLRFHYDPRLVCRPGCAVEPAAFPSDGSAPFVTVARPPPSFELYAP